MVPNSVEFMALREISQHLEAKIETVQSQIKTLAESTPKKKGSKRTS